jgi:NADH-quinone oxidoreductase subunit J
MLALKHIVPAPMGKYSIDYIERETHTKVLGTVLFNEYIFPFMIIALVLFVPMIAAVVLAIKRRKA